MELNYGMSLEQKQQLSQNQIQSLEVLAMDSVELSEFLQDEYLENPLLDYSEEHAMPGGREDIGQTYEQPPVLEQNYDDTAEEEDRRRKDIPGVLTLLVKCGLAASNGEARRQKASKTIFWISCRMEHAAGNWQSL